MHFTNLSVLGLVAALSGQAAANYYPPPSYGGYGGYGPDRTAQVVLKGIKVVANATNYLLDGIKQVNTTDIFDQVFLLDRINFINEKLQEQTALVNKTRGNLRSDSILNVSAKAQSLLDLVAKTLSVTKSKRDAYFVPAGTDLVVLDSLKNILSNADPFVDAIGAKLPKKYKFLARGDKRQLDLLFADAIAYFTPPPAAST